ncbi:BsuBI/PstI family type II restriction endonuclease [Photorhabdus sp. P32]|uniref:BsuBI/PstI family type II restriction endonuclease n=1 Tax=Photorhabdus sp. P32 TaxID=3117549 RepID=UPI00311ADC55
MNDKNDYIKAAYQIIISLGLPRAQQNERSALCLLALLNLTPGSVLVYAGDTGDKWGYFDSVLLSGLGVDVDSHGKMPDVVLHYTAKNWLLLAESVTSHGPVDSKRHAELAELFAGSTAGLVYVTAFPNRSIMSRYLGEIAWESEVWVADAPSHLIHFNGVRFLGPYE